MELLLGMVILMAISGGAAGEFVTPSEMNKAHDWISHRFLEKNVRELPFSFKYGGKASCEILDQWECTAKTSKLDEARRKHTITYRSPDTALDVTIVIVEYTDFPTVEWTMYLKNCGKSDTPTIENLCPLDAKLPGKDGSDFVLHHNVGSICQKNDYQPLSDIIAPNTTRRITTSGGRSSNSDLPYFNIQCGDEGVILAIGWPGQWAAEFMRDGSNVLRIVAGQELTHFVLHPGEEVRTPLIVLQFWEGDRLRSQNIWRRWMLAHNLPHPYGKQVQPHLAGCSSHQFGEMVHADTASQKLFIDRYLEEQIRLDYWWMDAGWYVNESGWPNTGTWEVDTKRFPGGLRPISDHAHSKGVKIIVWFEPERVTPGTWLYTQHPEWLLGADGGQKLLNLGDPHALKWLIEHIDELIVREGIDLYRNDFNIDPLPYWRENDPENRQGITEIKYVQGFLAFWDELRRRHPDMLIDTCASGGRRNDIETLRRSVPLHRSDYILEPIGQQCHTYGIASWIPFYGSGVNHFDAYGFRSVMCPAMNACYDVRRTDSDYDSLRRLIGEWRMIAPYLLGDYYPLTDYSTETDVWMGWQFYRPDLGEGVVQAFRRPTSPYESARFLLRGLDANAKYEVWNLDTNRRTITEAEKLMQEGLLVEMKNKPDSVTIIYKRQGEAKESHR